MGFSSQSANRPAGLFLAVTFGACVVGAGAMLWSAVEPEALEKMSAAQLVAEYEAAGLSTEGTRGELTDEMSAHGSSLEPNMTLAAVRGEILDRGPEIVPALSALLEQEAPKQRQSSTSSDRGGISLTVNILELLGLIGGPGSVPVVLRILEGWDGKVSRIERHAALNTLQKLTMVSFCKVSPQWAPSFDCVQHPHAEPVESFREYDTPARFYRDWLAGEGRDPGKWLDLARARARQLLAGSSLDDIYCAATFLRPQAGRDNDPDATLARLMEFVGKAKENPASGEYEIDGAPAPVSFLNWVHMVTEYGPRARPYASTLLRLQKERPLNDWSGYSVLRKIGGPEIVAHFVSVLPKVGAEADKILGSPEAAKGFSSDDPRLWWVSSAREVRFGIDRWAGRIFETDAERLAWWEANKERSPREWLEANLETLAGQLDRNVKWARWTAYEVLPDLPGNDQRTPHRRVIFLPGTSPPVPFAVEWLRKNRDSLRYDENAGCFRLGS
jgi:hypothetical protein